MAYRRSYGAFIVAVAVYVFAAVVGVLVTAPVRPGGPITASGTVATGPIAILVHNLRVGASLAAGGVLLGVPTFVTLSVNGVALGALVSSSLSNASWLVTVAAFAPHGVFEVPATCVSATVGFKPPIATAAYLRGDSIALRTVLTDSAILLATAGSLFVVAAFVEGVVTPALVHAVGG